MIGILHQCQRREQPFVVISLPRYEAQREVGGVASKAVRSQTSKKVVRSLWESAW